MKFAHILIPDFPVQVEILANPALRRRPIVIGGMAHEVSEVFACSPAGRQKGVEIGMPLRQAEQLAPEAVFLAVAAERYTDAHRSVMRVLEAFSPLRQTVAQGEICIDASGLEGLYGPDARLLDRLCAAVRDGTGLLPKVGLAANRFISGIAAGLAELGRGTLVPRGEEAAFLAPLDLGMLPLSEEAAQLLTRLGLLTVGQVAALPAGALSRTLGTEGERLHRLARGIDPTSLIPEYEQAPLSARVTLDWQLDRLPALIAYAEVLTGQLSGKLTRAGLAAGNVIVQAEQEDGGVLTAWGTLRPASNERKKLSDRAAGLLEAMDYTAAVTGLSVSLSPLEPAHLGVRQIPIGGGNPLTPDPLGHTLHTIRLRFGDGSIRDAAAVPGPPPEPIQVRTGEAGRPVAMVRGGAWSRIAQVQLHWRLEGDWWWAALDGAESSARQLAEPDGAAGTARQLAEPGAVAAAISSAGRQDYYQVVTRSGEIRVLLCWEGRWFLHRAAKPSQWPVT